MNRTQLPNPRALSLAMCLALATALWLNCVQTTELSHLHGWGDGYEQCLNCQTDGSSALNSSSTLVVANRATKLPTVIHNEPRFDQNQWAPPVRGPPQNT